MNSEKPDATTTHRERVLIYLKFLADPASDILFRNTADPQQLAIDLCGLWIENIFLPGPRNLDGLKGCTSEREIASFKEAFTKTEFAALERFHVFLELRLEMLPKRRRVETRFPDGEFWQNIFRHAANVLVEIDPDGLELDDILSRLDQDVISSTFLSRLELPASPPR